MTAVQSVNDTESCRSLIVSYQEKDINLDEGRQRNVLFVRMFSSPKYGLVSGLRVDKS